MALGTAESHWSACVDAEQRFDARNLVPTVTQTEAPRMGIRRASDRTPSQFGRIPSLALARHKELSAKLGLFGRNDAAFRCCRIHAPGSRSEPTRPSLSDAAFADTEPCRI